LIWILAKPLRCSLESSVGMIGYDLSPTLSSAKKALSETPVPMSHDDRVGVALTQQPITPITAGVWACTGLPAASRTPPFLIPHAGQQGLHHVSYGGQRRHVMTWTFGTRDPPFNVLDRYTSSSDAALFSTTALDLSTISCISNFRFSITLAGPCNGVLSQVAP
jgi:hypothetical protein